MRLLLAEDNRELAHWLEKALVQGGFAVDCVADGRAADHLLQSEQYALAVLDIGMPGFDGLEVVQRLRKRARSVRSIYKHNLNSSTRRSIPRMTSVRNPEAPERRCSSRTFRYGYLVTT